MKNIGDVLSKIISDRIIAIVRLKSSEQVVEIIGTLTSSGLDMVEVTTNTPGWSGELVKVRKTHPKVVIGAGTVTNLELAKKAIDSGAQFLVTPNVDPKVIEFSRGLNIPILVGAMTPTEIVAAVTSGADIVKLFPAGTLGPEYLKAVLGPFDQVKVFPVGGIDLSNMSLWVDAGAAGFGLGGSLIPTNQKIVDLALLAKKAKAFIKFVNTAEWMN